MIIDQYRAGIGGAPVSPLWTPQQISPALWIDPSDPSTITMAGSRVSAVADKAGNGPTFSQGTDSQRPFIGSLNGLGTLQFEGPSNSMLSSGASELGRNVNSLLVALVLRPHDATPSNTATFFCVNTALAQARFSINLLVNGTVEVRGRRLDGVGFGALNGSTTLSDNQAVLLVGYIDYANTTARLYINGTLDGQNTSFLTSGSTSDTQSASSSIGQFVSQTTPALDGDISDIVFVHNDVSTDTRQKLEGFAAWRRGLAGNLPISHPYRDSPPRL